MIINLIMMETISYFLFPIYFVFTLFIQILLIWTSPNLKKSQRNPLFIISLIYITNTFIYCLYDLSYSCILILHFFSFIISIFLGKHMRLIGITGHICSGKSSASAYIRDKHKYTVIDIDSLNREVLEYQAVKEEIKSKISPKCVDDKGIIDKKLIRELIYSDVKLRKAMEGITHKRVFQLFFKRLFYHKIIKFERHVFIENAILFKVPLLKMLCYPILSIVCKNKEILYERIKKRDNCTTEAAEKLLNSQISVEAYIQQSDYYYSNETSIEEMEKYIISFLNSI